MASIQIFMVDEKFQVSLVGFHQRLSFHPPNGLLFSWCMHHHRSSTKTAHQTITTQHKNLSSLFSQRTSNLEKGCSIQTII
jgi:hypothetical protein